MPRLLTVSALLACLLLMPACQSPRPITVIKRQAEFHFDQGRYERAAEDYQEIVDRAPGDWEAQYLLGLTRLELGQPDEARRALSQAHNLKPQNDDVADALAEAMYQQGATNELFAFLRERANSTQSTRSYLNLAEYATKTGDMDSASRALLTAIEVDEGRTVEPYLARAEFAARIGDTDEVVRRLRQAYGINPRDQRVLRKLEEYGEVPGPTLEPLPPGR